jgi:AAA+ superfamily predicted ATPase
MKFENEAMRGWFRRLKFGLLCVVLYLAAWGGLGLVIRDRAEWLRLLLALLLVPLISALDYIASRSTNARLRAFVRRPARYKVFDELHPSYRFVDFYRALEELARQSGYVERLEHFHPNHTLLQILGQASGQGPTPSTQARICVGYEEFGFFPNEVFWLLEGPPGLEAGERVIVRLSSRGGTRVEVASPDPDQAGGLLRWLSREALARSIFRGQFLEIHYRGSPHLDAYDYYQESQEMAVTFKQRPSVREEDIILDERVAAILRRNLFDFFTHRDCLYALGVPRKRAMLFYGPPGTGKTHTCRFIHTRLEGITSILVAGEALPHLHDIGRFARQLHPTLVVIEDVDLVFSAREVNPYGTILGGLMDQLDGFTPDEEVLFVLTTNAIDRVEQAIRDRPGRINQCLFFGLPTPELRRRYLLQFLRGYDISAVDLDHLVRQTEQTSQAFLKEYILRAVQIAAEANGYQTSSPPRLQTTHFDKAFEELTSHGDPHGHAIMGFHVTKP